MCELVHFKEAIPTTREDLLAFGGKLKVAQRWLDWTLGDYILQCRETFGIDWLRRKKAEDPDYRNWERYATVALAYLPSQRFNSLSFSHHAEALAAPEDKRLDYLRAAETNHWSTLDLRKAIRLDNASEPAEVHAPEESVVKASVAILREYTQEVEVSPPSAWDEDRIVSWLRILQPLVRIHSELLRLEKHEGDDDEDEVDVEPVSNENGQSDA